MRILTKSKKGQAKIFAVGPLLTVTIVIAILLIAFFLFAKSAALKPKVKDISALVMEAQSFSSLEAYINTPVMLNNQEIIMADLIRLAAKGETKMTLESETKKIFDKIYSDWAFSAAGVNIGSMEGKIISEITIAGANGERINVQLGVKA